MKNNSNKKLSMKQLQEQINALQADKVSLKNAIKPTTFKDKFQAYKSSFLSLYAISWLLFIINRLPFVGRFAAFLSKTYGKTSIWKILVLTRKVFILCNALIGLWLVYDITGVSQGSFVAGFAGLGNTYAEIFWSFSRRVFNFIFDFFDHKI